MKPDILARLRMALLAVVCLLFLWSGGKRVWNRLLQRKCHYNQRKLLHQLKSHCWELLQRSGHYN